MNNQLPMNVPGAGKAQTARPAEVVGLNSHKLDESQIINSLFDFVASNKSSDKKHRARFQGTARSEIKGQYKEEQAPVPKGTVGNAEKMRESILQLSLSPTIFRKKARVHHPGNVDFGNNDD